MRAAGAEAAGEDSPWPRTNAAAAEHARAAAGAQRLAEQVELMEQSAENYEDWQTCLSYVPVNEHGDRDRPVRLPLRRARRDRRRLHGCARRRHGGAAGAGRTTCSSTSPCRRLPEREPAARRNRRACLGQPAPAMRHPRNPARAARRADTDKRPRPPDRPQSSADTARAQGEPGCSRGPSDWRRSPSASTSGSHASRGCPSPRWAIQTRNSATSSGRRALRRATARRSISTVADWDDPDYMFLALVGGDRPGRTCQDEPGEGD